MYQKLKTKHPSGKYTSETHPTVSVVQPAAMRIRILHQTRSALLTGLCVTIPACDYDESADTGGNDQQDTASLMDPALPLLDCRVVLAMPGGGAGWSILRTPACHGGAIISGYGAALSRAAILMTEAARDTTGAARRIG